MRDEQTPNVDAPDPDELSVDADASTAGQGERVDELFEQIGLADYPLVQMAIAAAGVVAIALIAHFIARVYVIAILGAVLKRSRTGWDGALMDQKVFHRLIPIVPALVVYWGVEFVPHLHEDLATLIKRVAMATVIMVVARSISAFLGAVNVIYMRYPIARGRPIKGYLQVVKVITFIIAGILIFATLMDRNPLVFLGGIGAMSAVLLLIFRDTILSLVAGVQLTSNDLVRIGDWIDMPQFDADGDVVDVALNYIKVRNFDRTTTVIPTHKFLEHSFRNWRPMFEDGGRRIKRSVYIDMNTIRFLDEKEIRRFCRFLALQDYMDSKMRELEEYNSTQVPADLADVLANGRHLTNIGTFRAYITGYLRQHSKIHQELMLLVRQLQPTPNGLPIEIYAFTNDTAWRNYESIQSDIFDHILSVAPEFGLRVYQEPAGSDLARFAQVLDDRITPGAADGKPDDVRRAEAHADRD